MSGWRRKTGLSLLISALLLTSAPGRAEVTPDSLPDIGTTAGGTLSIDQERQMGDFYVRQLRASAPVLNDPVLTRYIAQLGQRLVAHASNVRMPFHFYLIQNDVLNAFAFFGGNVVLHSALFRYSDNESQLASVMAHEISHVTQRHLARAMEQQRRQAPLTWAGALGAALLTMASPQAGMAAFTGTLASAQQSVISFTQANEQEADRIGLQLLSQAGFDPRAMPAFLQKLADQTHYSTRPPEMLLTHPLPDSRLADIRNRASQLPVRNVASSLDYWLAKSRVLAMFSPPGQLAQTRALFARWQTGDNGQQIAARYGKAVLALEAKDYAAARDALQPLLTRFPDNVWFLDLMTDIDIGQHRAAEAVARLQRSPLLADNPVIQLNLANAYSEAGRWREASQLLYRYTYQHPEDKNGWDLLAQACARQGLQDEDLAARAELLALNGQFDQAIDFLEQAAQITANVPLKKARYTARRDQLRQLQQRLKQYDKSR